MISQQRSRLRALRALENAHTNNAAQSRALVRRLAMLIAGGVNPNSVWSLLENDPQVGTVARAVASDVEDGSDVAQALTKARLPAVAAVWQVAETAGSPMAEALTRLAEQLDALSDATRARQVAFAGPQATMRLVMALPLIGIAFSFLLGFNALTVLLGSPLGWVITATGISLLWLGKAWSAALMRKSAGTVRMPGYVSDLVVVALAGGSSVQRARLHVTDVLDRFRVPGTSLTELTSATGPLARSIQLAEAAGVSVSQMLIAEGVSARREYASELDIRAAKLGVTLMLPLGVCILPAFIVLSVIPMMVSLFQHSTIW